VSECVEAALRAAMADGGVVEFACDGMIIVDHTIHVSQGTLLSGSGRQVVISGGDGSGVFFVGSNATFTAAYLTIAHGRSTNGAAISNDRGTVNLLHVSFLQNLATNTLAPACGGAILNDFGMVNATSCLFSSNAARLGDNVAFSGLGGAICSRGGSLRLEQCAFERCVASGSSHWLTNSQPGGGACGGAIFNEGVLQVVECTFFGNTAGGGFGAFGANGCTWPMGCPGGNGGDGQGGAVYNTGLMIVDKSAFLSNSAAGGSGGPGGPGAWPLPDFGWPGGPGGNGGNGYGGAIFNGATGTLVNCTLAGNTGTGGGGAPGGLGAGIGPWGSPGAAVGAICDTNGLLRMTNCTLAFCSGNGGYGATVIGGIKGGGTTMANTLLADNIPGGNCGGALNDAGHNLSSDGTCSFNKTGSLNNLDPRLQTPLDNGGPTWTAALLPGSPAIDAGDSTVAPTVDQRGYPRPIAAAPDIGAFEFGSPAFLQIQRHDAAGLDVWIFAVTGRWFRLLQSADLITWTPISTNLIGSNGTATIRQQMNEAGPAFYRAVSP
jgi:hypothetical protein